MEHGLWEWVGFLALVVAMLALDLGVLNRKDHVIGPREALKWSALWVALALAFGGFVWVRYGAASGLEYLTGYVIEKSLSVDNIFVFLVIFSALGIPTAYQHRVLYWGICLPISSYGWGANGHRFITDTAVEECTCYRDCARDPSTACGAIDWHAHDDEPPAGRQGPEAERAPPHPGKAPLNGAVERSCVRPG